VTTHFTMANSFRFILESTAEITSYWDNRSRRSAAWHIGWKLWTSHVQGRERRAYTFFSTCVYVGLLTLYVEGSASSSPSPVRTLCFLNKQPSFSVVLLILDNSQLPKDNLIPLSSSFTIRTPHPRSYRVLANDGNNNNSSELITVRTGQTEK
jgi:hypothetical protein